MVAGKGPNLPDPSPPVEGDLVSQLVAGDGVCFQADLVPVRNDGKVVEAPLGEIRPFSGAMSGPDVTM